MHVYVSWKERVRGSRMDRWMGRGIEGGREGEREEREREDHLTPSNDIIFASSSLLDSIRSYHLLSLPALSCTCTQATHP